MCTAVFLSLHANQKLVHAQGLKAEHDDSSFLAECCFFLGYTGSAVSGMSPLFWQLQWGLKLETRTFSTPVKESVHFICFLYYFLKLTIRTLSGLFWSTMHLVGIHSFSTVMRQWEWAPWRLGGEICSFPAIPRECGLEQNFPVRQPNGSAPRFQQRAMWIRQSVTTPSPRIWRLSFAV